jgi:hypothetical protein
VPTGRAKYLTDRLGRAEKLNVKTGRVGPLTDRAGPKNFGPCRPLMTITFEPENNILSRHLPHMLVLEICCVVCCLRFVTCAMFFAVLTKHSLETA